jgi:DedD protein
MRRRARHRLLGAAVLVLLGVIGFPLLFDTQPRPIAVDIPIDIPDRAKSKPLTVPPAPVAKDADAGSRVAAAPASGGMITERADGTEIPSDKPVLSPPPEMPRASAVPEPAPAPERRPETRPEPRPEVATSAPEKNDHRADAKPAPAAPAKPAPADDGTRARALLEGKAPTAAAAAAKPAAGSEDSGRFVVQVGAFADADKAREVRQKLERAGLKTYTHVAKTADGERTRVRVGPFSSRAEADRAASRVKGLSLPAAVLTL